MAKQQKPTRVIKGDTTKYSILKSGAQVPTRKIDSIKKANPAAGKMIGSGGKQYGATRYGEQASDVIKGALKRKNK